MTEQNKKLIGYERFMMLVILIAVGTYWFSGKKTIDKNFNYAVLVSLT